MSDIRICLKLQFSMLSGFLKAITFFVPYLPISRCFVNQMKLLWWRNQGHFQFGWLWEGWGHLSSDSRIFRCKIKKKWTHFQYSPPTGTAINEQGNLKLWWLSIPSCTIHQGSTPDPPPALAPRFPGKLAVRYTGAHVNTLHLGTMVWTCIHIKCPGPHLFSQCGVELLF